MALAVSDKQGQIIKTTLLDEIERIATEHDAGLIILDAAADFFGGNENERGRSGLLSGWFGAWRWASMQPS
jgi:RecA-family ATPase